MTNKFHINKHGIAARCDAKEGNCPLGGDSGNENHFKTKEEAQERADEINENKFGLLPNGNSPSFTKASGEADKKHMAKRFNILHTRSNKKKRATKGEKNNYVSRCHDTEKIPNYTINDEQTAHYRFDRTAKEKRLTDTFGKGEVIGHYKVNHIVDNENDVYADQVVEIRDNGRITIYDYDDGRKVTTFMAHEERIEVMMLHSGEIPSNNFLKDVKSNFRAESSYQAKVRKEKEAAVNSRRLAIP